LPLRSRRSSIKNGGRSLPHYRVIVPIRGHILQQLTLLHRGTGYIGSFTALALLEAGYKVVVTDNLYNSSEEVLNRIELICGKRPEFVKLDVKNEEAFDDVFSKHPDIDSVIHFAALKVGLVAANTARTEPKIAATMPTGKR
jgi:NAD(P)-dependent dehydrogenase (short-subunit alcohol dehydrogenase family)